MTIRRSYSRRWLSCCLLACSAPLLASAQPQSSAFRITKAVAVMGSDLFLYGDPSKGWVAGNAPWTSVNTKPSGNDPGGFELSSISWMVPSDDDELFVYGQTLCADARAKGANAPHTYVTTSGSAVLKKDSDKGWSPSSKAVDVLGPRIVRDDQPTPVQAFDPASGKVYTFVYDTFNPQLGMTLFTFSSDDPPSNIGQSATNTTMDLAPKAPETPAPPPPPPPTNSTGNGTVPIPPPAPVTPSAVPQAAPFVDVGAAVFANGMIVVLGGGRPQAYADLLSNYTDDFEPSFGYYKMDRCWTYDPTANQWTKRTLTAAAGGSFPTPRRLHALLAVGNKIYMHGGNTTTTDPEAGFATDLWILDTTTWLWSKGASSENGRAYHTLVHFQNTIFAVSGYTRQPTSSSPAQNAFLMMYSVDGNSWSAQFGTIEKSFFQEHIALILGSTAAVFVALVALGAVVNRLLRRRRHLDRRYDQFDTTKTLGRKKTKMPFLAKSAKPVEPVATARVVASGGSESGAAAAAAAGGLAMGGATANEAFNSRSFQNQYSHMHGADEEEEIDLSAVRPQPSGSLSFGSGGMGPFHQTTYQQQQQQYEQQQQQMPLMAADALDQQDFRTPYRDEPSTEGPSTERQLPQRFSQQFGLQSSGDHIQVGGFVYGTSNSSSGHGQTSSTGSTSLPSNNNDLPPI
ncbi:hypothetical protein BGW41_003716 [Actinomortierella wolfii]|nr:hypothetical protein BGW41_003716 [Actinomortierella wolfii]